MSSVRSAVGRSQFLSRLAPLPVCSLLLAPHSTGKRTLALAAARAAGIPAVDTLLLPAPYWATSDGRQVDPADVEPGVVLSQVEPALTAADVRALREWATRAPHTVAGKVAVVRLGHSTDHVSAGRSGPMTWVAAPRLQSMLLKLLEEPPPGVRFVLTAVGAVLPTVASRSVVLSAGLLSTPELASVLDRISDLSPEQCQQIATQGVGRVRPALALAARSSDAELVRVRAVLAAMARSDGEALASAAPGWTEESTALLQAWSHERLTGRWRQFEVADAVLPRPVAWQLAQRLSAWAGVRPRLLLASLSEING